MDKLKQFTKQIEIFSIENKTLTIIFLISLFTGALMVPKIFAQEQEIKNIKIFSEKANYERKNPGAWKVNKSAKWISKNTVEITFNIDTISQNKSSYKDIILVLDVSGSMSEKKLKRVKEDTSELVSSILSEDKNRIGLITFNSNSQIDSKLTNNKDELLKKISSLTANECTNYYQALINADSILKDYKKEEDRECVVLFLTDGYPNEETPNEEGEYRYLKNQYPFITVSGIQYEMGKTILKPIKKVSDNQFLADMNTLNNVLFEAADVSAVYENFEITDYINTNYFYVESEKDISASQGNIEFDKGNQKLTWKTNYLRTGTKAQVTIKIKLKEEYIGKEGLYPTNLKEEIKSKIDENNEDIISNETPILSNGYKVIYKENVLFGCNVVGNTPTEKTYFTYDTVELSDNKLRCPGYKFKGWEIVNEDINMLNASYFTMPEEDVIIRGIWGKTSLEKKLDGTVAENKPNYLERVIYNEETDEMQSELAKYADSIVKIVFQNKINPLAEAIEVLDLSENKDERIKGYIVPTEENNTQYIAYIQSDESILANPDSSYLFYNFKNLTSIDNIDLLDTSHAENMTGMFYGTDIETLDFSHFDTSKVTNMSGMFYYSSFTELDLSSFDTSNVENMSAMFYGSYLSSINVSSFDTSKVTDMSGMFYWNDLLTELDLSSFDTSNVTSMDLMFSGCGKLVTLDISNFDFSKVETANHMFWWTLQLKNMKVNNINLYSLKEAELMFCYLGNVDITITIGSNIQSYDSMFNGAVAGGGKAVINYLDGFEPIVDAIMKTTNNPGSNLIKGEKLVL